MKTDKEQSMRSTLADYPKGELIDLAVRLQGVIDDHIHEKTGLQSSIDAMKGQIPILQAELDKYEGGGAQLGPAEKEALEAENIHLRERCSTLQALNEKLQGMLVGD